MKKNLTSIILRILILLLIAWAENKFGDGAMSVYKRQLPSDPWQLFNISVTSGNRTEGRFPNVFNLATRAHITSNATCGDRSLGGREQFCKLVEHVRRRPGDRIQCGVCVAGEAWTDTEEAHPIQYAIDGSNRWWQSPTIANGWRFNVVTITLDLKQIYQVAYVIIKAANSPRPGNWILERSTDGVDYKPWQYFAMTDSDCWNLYRTAPTVGVPRYHSDDDVICTSAYSQLNPLEDGEIHISLVNNRPGVAGPSKTLMEFTAARYIRLRLQRIRTLNADLMLPAVNDPRYLDSSVTNRYYYSIKDISVGGQCICYGHARHCPMDPATGGARCQCEGNTCGANCEKCCPLYNQIPWRQGTYTEGAACEQCNCFGHSDSCVYNETVARSSLSLNMQGEYKGGGVCLGCQHNTMGINCEMCADGYYRPSNLRPDHPLACQPCDCNYVGATGLCAKDDTDIRLRIVSGDCICREGYCGQKCDECAKGYTGYPHCMKCPCNLSGTVSDDPCKECKCKENVCGENCDECLPGFYNLRADNPSGCEACFCFGISDQCASSSWGRTKISALDEWYITDVAGSGKVNVGKESTGAPFFMNEQTTNLNRNIYWLAPQNYIGNKVASYGGNLDYSFLYSINCSTTPRPNQDSYLANEDVILEGSGMRIGIGGMYMDEETLHIVNISMTEDGWRHLVSSTAQRGQPVSRQEFLVLLADIDRMLIRASYNVYQAEMTLFEVDLDQATGSAVGLPMASVEMCACPLGYAGTSCETCAKGFRRKNHKLVKGLCEPCECHGHSDECNPLTGECLNCQHNTRGSRCEKCEYGYRGDPRNGDPYSCKLCDCPLPMNRYAETCVEVVDPRTGRMDHKCVNCRPGYGGQYCERCSHGYYGNPLIPGVGCRPCDCSGNSPDGEKECDPVTGRCHMCIGHTDGDHCEKCQKGFYGSAINGDCTECSCSRYGSVSTDCDSQSGQCQCRERYTGRDCGQCLAGYGNIQAGCTQCNCRGVGMSTALCDPVTGDCLCNPGIGGSQCHECLPGFFQYSPFGCRDCNCDKNGSVTSLCNPGTGQCQCHPGVTGMNCNRCEENYWNFTAGIGCRMCQCNQIGSTTSRCHPDSGSCYCKPGVAGEMCDKCASGYYGFSVQGCRRCRQCPAGHTCDPGSGQCVCPPLTEGRFCERCVTNSWGYTPETGCKPCDCNPVGSDSSSCDSTSGQCNCIRDFTGQKCDHCPLGQHQFPQCRPCQCDARGIRLDYCNGTACGCQDNGTCVCKEKVEGVSCSQCKPNTFGLAAELAHGCTSCFCFGRTDQCRQADYVWSELTVPSQTVISRYRVNTRLKLTPFGILIIPEEVGEVSIDPQHTNVPLYWSISKYVLGDMTLSYNGLLQFTLLVDGGRNQMERGNDQLADIILVGNYRLRLHYTARVTSPSVALRGRQGKRVKVHLREDQWTTQSGGPVSRELMMTALQNVQRLFLKVFHQAGAVQTMLLRNVTIQKAVSSEAARGSTAVGIEMCTCPPKYIGLSCQDPADGHYRKRPDNFKQSDNLTDLVGESEPCECNGRSSVCDKETGHCQNCSPPTGGPHCRDCADGFYNSYPGQRRLNCRPCSCPSTAPESNFSPTCVSSEHSDGFTCNACSPGHTGNKCEKCELGYYGEPEAGRKCRACSCSLHGSVDQFCDQVTGQCRCTGEGVTGRACDQCLPRHTIVAGRCHSCNDSCTGSLLDSVDGIVLNMTELTSAATSFEPWVKLSELESAANKSREWMMTFDGSTVLLLTDQLPTITELAERLRQKGDEVQIRSDTEKDISRDIKQEADEVLRIVLQEYDKIKAEVDQIKYENRNITEVSGSGITPEEAEQYLQNIQSFDIDAAVRAAEDELMKAAELLRRVQEAREKAGPSKEVVSPEDEKLIENLRERLEVLRSIINDTGRTNSETEQLNVQNRDLLNKLKTRLPSSSAGAGTESRGDCERAANLTMEASRDLQETLRPNNQASQDLLERLNRLQQLLADSNRQKEEELQEPMLLVSQAYEHADNLHEQAEGLDGLLLDTRSLAKDPVAAAEAYERTKEAVELAEAAVLTATESTREAFEMIVENSDGTLADQASRSRQRSRDLNDESTNQNDIIQHDLLPQLNDVKATAKHTEENLREIRDIIENLNQDLTIDAEGKREDVLRAISEADSAINTAEHVDRQVDRQIEKMEEDFIPKIEEMGGTSSQQLEEIDRQVSESQENIDEVLNLTRHLDGSRDRFRQLGKDIGQSILELQKLIEEARARAASIKVSLHHTGKCVRRYAVPDRASLSNTITLHYKTNSSDKDQLLFLLKNPSTSDFLALELRNRRVNFVWDIGAGPAVVGHPEIISTFENVNEEKEKWYRIHAERRGNVGKLTVQRVSDMGLPVDATEVANPSHTRFDLLSTMDLFIAGAPSSYDLPHALGSRSFDGCIGEVKMDGIPIGLYNFRWLVEDVGCSGCFNAPIADPVSSDVYQFNGMGYAAMPQIRYTPNRYRVFLEFKTYWKDALLFFTANDNTGDFISLELRDGKVVFRYGFKGKAETELSTQQTYNTNKWVKVRVAKEGTEGILEMDNEKITGRVDGVDDAAMDLRDSSLYFAGISQSTFTDRYKIGRLGFLGCMREVVVSSKGPYTQNLLEGLHVGMTPGCSNEKSTKVGLPGDGHVELPSPDLPYEASVMFSFRSQQEDALMLLAIASVPNTFYSASLREGKVHVWLNAGTGTVRISTRDTYHDGLPHSLSIHKENGFLQLFIDNVRVGSARIPDGATSVGNMRGKDGGLYLGGIPPGVDGYGMAASLKSFKGCIMDLIINNELVVFDEPLSFDEADIGRCSEKDLFPNLNSSGLTPGSVSSTAPRFTVTVTLPGGSGQSVFTKSPYDTIGTRYPGEVTRYPGEVTSYPGERTRYPGEVTSYPGEGTIYPGEGTRYPGEVTSYPGEGTRYPGEVTRYPGEVTSYPGERTRYPGEVTRYPGEVTSYPGQRTRYPSEVTRYPGEVTSYPGEKTRYPGEVTRYPGEVTRYPGEVTSYPGEGTIYPGEVTSYPGEGTRYPGEGTRYPGEVTSYPGEGTSYPGEGTRYPGEVTSYPGEGTRYPGEGTRYPAEVTGYPAEVTSYQGEGTSYPGEVTRHPGSSLESPNDIFSNGTTPMSEYTTRRWGPWWLSTTTARPPGSTPIPISCAMDNFGTYKHAADAVSFGGIKNSHAEVNIRTEHLDENFNLTMLFRTFYDKGLLFYASNRAQTEYIALQMMQNRMTVAYDHVSSRDTKLMHSDILVADGMWHQITLIKTSDRIQIRVDDALPISDTIRRVSTVAEPIYVGGLPDKFKPPNNVITESFKGCAKDFELSGHQIDIANSKAIMGVKQCFLDGEFGVHFDGYGYAIYSDNFSIESDFSISFDFRTSQQNGIIATISSFDASTALTLELHEGKLKFNTINMKSMHSVETEVCEHCLCNNQWHSVTATLSKYSISLQLDDQSVKESPNSGIETSLNIVNELYIGGFPHYAFLQGAAHTSEFFHGCLRKFIINNSFIHWHDMTNLFDVHVSSCPVAT